MGCLALKPVPVVKLFDGRGDAEDQNSDNYPLGLDDVAGDKGEEEAMKELVLMLDLNIITSLVEAEGVVGGDAKW
ncbi:hypothetical protein C5167_008862 [Papaver somniferum]|uniref:Uncharacterized protein n=1 Tax=Papaver somniferum TaxID=3469 RepID=A0A4Y7JVQ6_PAPSO|nr:hypothetical protein C5167_008862 [Papaver somniferum]